jgi:tripartite ATP-independent transporter DctP family solute receptor
MAAVEPGRLTMDRRRALLSTGLLALAGPQLLRARPASAARTLRFSHTDTAVGARQQAAELFAAKVDEYTAGRLKVQVFHSGQLANDPKAVEQLQLGGLDFTVTGTGTYATHVTDINLLVLPYLVESYEQGWQLYDSSPWIADTFGQLPAKGVRILATWEAGFRSFTTKMPVSSPADLKGQKIRIFPNEMLRWIIEAMGANPVVMPVTEVYLAIQQGTVVGQENPIDTIFSQRFYEVAPHITLTQHIYSPIPMSVSESTWQSLSAEDRDAVSRAAQEAADWIREEVKANDDRLLADMEGRGAKVGRPDLAAFKAAVEPVMAKARETYGADTVDRILADAQAVRA